MSSTGTVQVWNWSEGWGIIDSPDTPGGCFAHYTDLWRDQQPKARADTAIEVSGEFRDLVEGETVDFEWERPEGGQDGYPFRATAVRPRRPAPRVVSRSYRDDEQPAEKADD
jgi:CspA family cold shock protein